MWQPRVKHFTWGKCSGCQPIPECWTLIEKDKKKKLGIVCENWWDFTVYRSNQIKKKNYLQK